jgi:hypothetical protein
MEDSMKKPIMIVVIVACLGVAGLVLFSGGPDGGASGIPEGDTMWVKCNNKACNAEYEMGKRKYYQELEANVNPNPMATGPTPVPCKECGEKSLFAAVKCANPDCGLVFIEGSSGPDDYGDRCPKCKQSAVEERMKARQAGGQ